MARYLKSPEAEKDLIALWLYVSQENQSSATQLIDRLHGQMKLLADMPGLGRSRKDLAPRLRSFPMGTYLIFYREIPDGIEVARVLSARRDLRDLFD